MILFTAMTDGTLLLLFAELQVSQVTIKYTAGMHDRLLCSAGFLTAGKHAAPSPFAAATLALLFLQIFSCDEV